MGRIKFYLSFASDKLFTFSGFIVLQGMMHVRPTFKSSLCPTHRLGEIKNSHEPPAGRDFFLQSLYLKRYKTKRFKKISS